MENYQAKQRCYNQNVSYFKQFFSFALCSTFEKWAEKNRLFTLGSLEVPRQTRNLEPSEESATASIKKAEHDTSQSTPKKTMKRDSWSSNQTGALINAWKENFFEIETYRQPSAWLKMKAAVDNYGPEKSVKQIQAKLRYLKDAYKQVKEINSRTGAWPQSCPRYNDFNELLEEETYSDLKYLTVTSWVIDSWFLSCFSCFFVFFLHNKH